MTSWTELIPVLLLGVAIGIWIGRLLLWAFWEGR